MARQKGIHPLSGSAGDMNYYKTRRDGDLARKKAKISKKRLRHGPEFANSRKAGKVFGLASTASRLVRTAFGEMILGGSKSDMNNRMLARIRENAEGIQRLHHLPFQQLQGFQINEHAVFSAICSITWSVEMTEPGKITVSFPAFNPRLLLKPPSKNTTHFRFMAGAAVIDCKRKTFNKDVQSAPPIVRDQPLAEPVQLRLSVPAPPGRPLLVAIGIVFSQLINREHIDSVDEHYTPVLITDVVYDPPPDPPRAKPASKKKSPPAPKNKAVKKKAAKKKPKPRK